MPPVVAWTIVSRRVGVGIAFLFLFARRNMGGSIVVTRDGTDAWDRKGVDGTDYGVL